MGPTRIAPSSQIFFCATLVNMIVYHVPYYAALTQGSSLMTDLLYPFHYSSPPGM